MEIEYEAKFLNVDKDEVRVRFKKAGAKLERAEFLQRRYVLRIPGEENAHGTWMRVRDQGDKITMAWKSAKGGVIEGQKEVEVIVSDFEKTVQILELTGCTSQSYQENTREIWTLDQAEIVIDSWPFLEPLVEVEGPSEAVVRTVSEKIGFNWNEAHFKAPGAFYKMKYGPSANISEVPRLTFDMTNPFT